jgi:hypothetical protein
MFPKAPCPVSNYKEYNESYTTNQHFDASLATPGLPFLRVGAADHPEPGGKAPDITKTTEDEFEWNNNQNLHT